MDFSVRTSAVMGLSLAHEYVEKVAYLGKSSFIIPIETRHKTMTGGLDLDTSLHLGKFTVSPGAAATMGNGLFVVNGRVLAGVTFPIMNGRLELRPNLGVSAHHITAGNQSGAWQAHFSAALHLAIPLSKRFSLAFHGMNIFGEETDFHAQFGMGIEFNGGQDRLARPIGDPSATEDLDFVRSNLEVLRPKLKEIDAQWFYFPRVYLLATDYLLGYPRDFRDIDFKESPSFPKLNEQMKAAIQHALAFGSESEVREARSMQAEVQSFRKNQADIIFKWALGSEDESLLSVTLSHGAQISHDIDVAAANGTSLPWDFYKLEDYVRDISHLYGIAQNLSAIYQVERTEDPAAPLVKVLRCFRKADYIPENECGPDVVSQKLRANVLIAKIAELKAKRAGGNP